MYSQSKADNLESCYVPIVMSGGVYDLRASATSNDDMLHQGNWLKDIITEPSWYIDMINLCLYIRRTDRRVGGTL